MEQSKVIRHPDKDELIKMLLNGDSVKQIEAWLKKKYPRSKMKEGAKNLPWEMEAYKKQ